MDATTVQIINEETKRFYAECVASFSATRNAAWQGWEHLPSLVVEPPKHVWDLGCGNLRFERFLTETFPEQSFSVEAWDSCASMPDFTGLERVDVTFQEVDIVEALLAGGPLAPDEPADLTVAFGLFHHVPSCALRTELLRAMCMGTRAGCLVAVSLWDARTEERGAKKAAELTPIAQEQLGITDLEPGDCFLGWQDRRDIFRFCHCFDEEEARELAAAVAEHAKLEALYRADGKDGASNTYLCLRVL